MHHIQKEIVLKLNHAESARFSDLKPKDIDGNVFTYHLKQLIAARMVKKADGGAYELTQKGKLAGINVRLTAKDELEQAHPVLFLAVKDSRGRWLVRRRTVHPSYGRVGFLHTEPNAHEDIFISAKRGLKEKTGFVGDFSVRGSGYVTLLKNSELESYTQFTMLYCDKVSGNLTSKDRSGENFWYKGNFGEDYFFPNMLELMNKLKGSKDFFISVTGDL